MIITIVNDILAGSPNFPKEQLCTFKIDLDKLVCPITGKKIVDPVVASDGHTYEHQSLEDWFAQQPDRNFTKSPVAGCNNILEVDNQQKLILRSNLLIKDLLALEKSANEREQSNNERSLDIDDSGLIDHITLSGLIRIPIICADGKTYDLNSESQWLAANTHLNTSLSREQHTYATFPNLLVQQLLQDFRVEYNGLNNVKDIDARKFLHLLQNGQREEAIDFLNSHPELATKSIDGNNAQLVHILASFDDIEMIHFLVKNKGVQLSAQDANGSTALIYACKGSADKFLDHIKSSEDKNTNINTIIMFAILMNRPDIIKKLFEKGFKIEIIDFRQLSQLIGMLGFTSFQTISLIFEQLKTQGYFNHLKPLLRTIVGGLAVNKTLSVDEFVAIFEMLDDALRSNIFFGEDSDHPYILGCMSKNVAYLKGFDKYWRQTGEEEIINLPNNRKSGHPPIAIPATALQMATFSKLSRLIVTALSFGADPCQQDKTRYSFDIALKILLESETQWWLVDPKIILNYLLTEQCIELHPEHMYKILSRLNVEKLNKLLISDDFSIIQQMHQTKNIRLKTAYQKALRENKQVMNAFTADLTVKKRNFLHAICVKDDAKDLSIYIANMYPDLLAQKDDSNETPLDEVLKHGKSIDLIKELLNIIKRLLLTPRFKDFDYHDILNNGLLESNPNFTFKQRKELYTWLGQNFAATNQEQPKLT